MTDPGAENLAGAVARVLEDAEREGLPPHVEDPDTLARVADALRTPETEQGAAA